MEEEIKPALGERRAVAGYSAQYHVVAEIVYDALINDELLWISLADLEVGRVDDGVIATKNEIYGIQVKWSIEYPTTVTYGEIKGTNKTEGLIAQLADGWIRLKKLFPDKNIIVQLISNDHASTSSTKNTPNLAKFINEGWTNNGLATIEESEWKKTFQALEAATKLKETDFDKFRKQCQFNLNHSTKTNISGDDYSDKYTKDISTIHDFLFRTIGQNQPNLKLDKAELIKRLGWNGRFEPHAVHKFPVNQALYQPNQNVISQIENCLSTYSQGYLALLGTPGSGKSTLLTQTLNGRQDIELIQYYCYVPNNLALDRGEAQNFLHDLTVALWENKIRPKNFTLRETLQESKALFVAQLQELHDLWNSNNKLTLILIDGLDHIDREQNPVRSLIAELPAPEQIPQGVVILLGSQKLELDKLNPAIAVSLGNNRIIQMTGLLRESIRKITSRAIPDLVFSEEQLCKIESLSGGHPLALHYLLNRIQGKTPGTLDSALKDMPPYADSIEDQYKTYWKSIENNSGVVDLLALFARIRLPIDLQIAETWADETTLKNLVNTASHYFQKTGQDIWSFYHNSFRQFILDNTGRGTLTQVFDENKHRAYHLRLAELSTKAPKAKAFFHETLFHLYSAEKAEEVIQIGTQQYFRNQFFAIRPSYLIRDDIALLIRVAQKKEDPLVLVRALLIDEEINQRTDTFYESDIVGFLIDINRIEDALNLAFNGNELIIEEENALTHSITLVERGYYKEGERLFFAAEPLAILNGNKELDLHFREDMRVLKTWVKAAIFFRPIDEIVKRFEGFQFKTGRDELPHERHEEAQEDFIYSIRSKLIKEIVLTGNQERIDELLTAFADSPELEEVQLDIDILLCANFKGSPWIETSITRLAKQIQDGNLDIGDNVLIILAEAAFKANNPDLAKTLVKNVSQPLVDHNQLSTSSPRNLNYFARKIRFNRLLSSLKTPTSPGIAVPQNQDAKKIGIIFERMLVQLSNLQGQAQCSKLLPPFEVMQMVEPMITFFNNRFSDRERFERWYPYDGLIPDFCEFLIKSVSAHGEECIEALGEFFDLQWQSEETGKYWPLSFRRRISLALFKVSRNETVFIKRLETIENRLLDVIDLHDRIEEYSSQARAWKACGRLDQALTYLPIIIERSFGIEYEKDHQLGCWIDLLDLALKQAPEILDNSLNSISAGLCTCGIENRGYGTTNAIVHFLQLVATYKTESILPLLNWFVDQGSIKLFDGMKALCMTALKRSDISIDVGLELVCRLYIPYNKSADSEISKALAEKLFSIPQKSLRESKVAVYIQKLEVDCPESLRRSWLDDFVTIGNKYNYDCSPFFEKLNVLPLQKDNSSPESVKLKTGKTLEENELNNKIQSSDDLIKLLSDIEESHFYGWDKLVERYIPELTTDQTTKVFDEFIRLGIKQNSISLLLNKLIENGNSKKAETYALRSLDKSSGYGWVRTYDGGTRLKPYQFLCRVNPEKYRKKALQHFANDYISEMRNPRECVRQLDELIPIFWQEPPWAELWNEIQEHLFSLTEFAHSQVNFDAEPTPSSPEDILIDFLFKLYLLSIPELRQDTYMAIISCSEENSLFKIIHSRIQNLVQGSGKQPLLGMALLEYISRSNNSVIRQNTEHLISLSNSPDMAIRLAACELLGRINVSPKLPSDERKSMPAFYNLLILPFQTTEILSGDILLEPGMLLPSTSDPVELTTAVKEGIEKLVDFTGIPFEYLVHRTALYMHSTMDSKDWDRDAESQISNKCRRLGFETSYRRPRADCAITAFCYLVAELFDAGKIKYEELNYFLPFLNITDPLICDKSPIYQKPIHPVGIENGVMFSEENWFSKNPSFLDGPTINIENGKFLIGYMTIAETLAWNRPKEESRGAICSPIIDEEIATSPSMPFISSKFWWRACDYPTLNDLEIPARLSLLISGETRRVEIGSTNWIALNPNFASALGWHYSNEGLFRWIDDGNEIMVESVWWRNGRLGRYPPSFDDIRSEGWYVFASKKALKELLSLVKKTRWISVCRKSYTPHKEKLPQEKTYFSRNEIDENRLFTL